MAVNPFLRGMTGQQMGLGRPSLAQMMAPATAPTPTVAGPTMAAAQPLDIAGLRRQVLAQAAAPTAPQSRQALMAKYGLAPTAPAPKPSPMQRLSAALPASGTPEMAGLGAAGRTMLELSGYQPIAQAPSIGQILARSAEAGIGAMEKRKAAEEARAQAEAEAQAAAAKLTFEQDLAMKELKIKQDKEAREAAAAQTPKGPVSAAGKYALDLGFTPGTPEFTAAMKEFKAKAKEPTKLLRAEGILLENGKYSNKKVYTQETPEGGSVTMIEDRDAEGGFRPFDPSVDEFIEKDLADDFLLNEKEMDARNTEINTLSKGVKGFQRMYDALETQEKGFEALGTKITSEVKTLLGQGLTENEVRQKLTKGLQMGLLGQLRVDVVGPGVMTEQDAQKLIDYLGGDLRDIRTDPATVQAAVKIVLGDKTEEYNTKIGAFNRQVSLRPPKSGYSIKEPIVTDIEAYKEGQGAPAPEGVDPSVWSVMTPDERALWS